MIQLMMFTDCRGLFTRLNQKYDGPRHGRLSLTQRLIVVIHVGFVDDDAPVVLPMIGRMAQFSDSPTGMYIHGLIHRRLTLISGDVSGRLM